MRTTVFHSVPSKFLAVLAIIAMVLAALPVMPAYAASITVTTTADELTTDGFCSLREALLNANNNASAGHPDCIGGTGADTIILTGGAIYTLSLVATDNTGGDLDVTDPAGLTIQTNDGTPATIDAADIDRVLDVATGAGNLTLTNLIITNGTATAPATGGGISVASTTTLTLTNSTVSNNVATSLAGCGAGIYSNSVATIVINNSTISGNACSQPGADGGGLFKGTGGSLTITNSTFSGNSTADDGAGIELSGGSATITNSTFYGNIASNRGGAIHVGGAAVTVDFSTFSDNTANGVGNNGGGAIQVSAGSAAINRSILANSTVGRDCNQSGSGTTSITDSLVEVNTTCSASGFIGGDPGLSAPANNGGSTLTMAIGTGSPAYNAADTCNAVTTDQRGMARPQGLACDLGAFEVEGPPVVVSVLAASPNPTSAATVDYTVTFSEPVTGVQTSDFALDTTLSDAVVSAVSPLAGPATVYTVTVNTGTGNGTIKLVVPNTATAKDASNNNLAGLPFTNGDVYDKFQVAPGKATLNTPSGSIGTNFIPTYTWNKVPDTTWYYLWINNPSGQTYFTRWYQAADVCGASTCSVTAPKSLQAIGTHTWWIQTWNEVGYGPWSDGLSFTTTTPAAPGMVTLVSPNAAIGDTTPTYTWNKLNGATWYYLWVNKGNGTTAFQPIWYDAAEICSGSTCSITPAGVTLPAGDYTWWVQAWNPGGYGPWNAGTNFSLALPPAATLLTPSGAISDTSPTYTWNKVTTASWYYLWVNQPDGATAFQPVWYQASAICGATTCSVTPNVNLGSGTHTWWIQTWNDVGYGPWSPGKTFTLP